LITQALGDSGFPLGKKDGSQIVPILECSLLIPRMRTPHHLRPMGIRVLFYFSIFFMQHWGTLGGTSETGRVGTEDLKDEI